MHQRNVYWMIAAFAIFISLATTVMWLSSKRSRRETRFSESVADQRSSLCEYVNKITPDFEVQLRGILLGFHEVALYDPNCAESTNAVMTNLEPSARNELIDSVNRLGSSAFQRGNFWVMATVRGKFESFEPLGNSHASTGLSTTSVRVSTRYKLIVSDIDNVEDVSPNITWPQ